MFGERIWAERTTADIPRQFLDSKVPAVTYAFQIAGIALLTYGLIVLGLPGLLYVAAGITIVQCAKAWFIDRMVLLFADMKNRDQRYADWEHGA
ncbi:hypothetical protein JIG36_50685 [Actinoplanes sp. LDG1-06]|uniref:Uncharacterized protein n=1 Tax=Paractinoplanes ovalisporus TaxID=2810368 RepID=A0ABS2AVP1_9ACTN|nr:hypothetical protein [Actinoplanes ovalisporus]